MATDTVTMVTAHLATHPCSTIVEVYQGILSALLEDCFTVQTCNSSSIATLALTHKHCNEIQGTVKIFLINTSLVIHCKIGEELVSYSEDLSKELRLDVPMSLQALRDPARVIHSVNTTLVNMVILKAKAMLGHINLPLFERLPDDVILHIFGYLEYRELLTVGTVCTKFRELSIHDPLWSYRYMREFRGKELTIRSGKSTWRHAFADFKRMELEMEKKDLERERRRIAEEELRSRTRYDIDFRYDDII